MRIYLTVLTLTAVSLSSYRSYCAIQQRTAADEAAAREYALALPELNQMSHVLRTEIQRLLGENSGPRSPDVAEYVEASSPRIDLGDLDTPLHLRFKEALRQALVAGIAVAKTSGNCGSPNVGLGQLLDAALRAKVLSALKCHQEELDRYQSGMHKVNQDYEARLRELKLPAFTQEKTINEARADSIRQDASVSVDYAKRRKVLQANANLITYLDGHATHAHYSGDQLLFDDPVEAAAMLELLNRLAAVSQ
jgi:hypothetical protein